MTVAAAKKKEKKIQGTKGGGGKKTMIIKVTRGFLRPHIGASKWRGRDVSKSHQEIIKIAHKSRRWAKVTEQTGRSGGGGGGGAACYDHGGDTLLTESLQGQR